MQNLGGKQSVLWAIGKWSIAPRVLTSSRSCLAVIVVIIIAFDKEGEWRSNITACSPTWFSDAQDRYMFPGERNSLKPKWRRKETKCRREKPFDLRSSYAKMILVPLTYLRCLRIQPFFFFAPCRLGRFARETFQAAKSKERRLYSQATFCAYSLSLYQVMQARVPNMLTNARCVPREVSCSAVTPVHWLIISTVSTHHWGEYRAGTGPVRSALGPMTRGREAVVLKKLL